MVVFLQPVRPTLEGYQKILTYGNIMTGHINSIWYAACSVLLGLILTVCVAFPFSQENFDIGDFLSKVILFTIFFSGGMIPTYFVVKSLKMLNTPLAGIVLGAVSVFNIIITWTYFKSSIPLGLRSV